MKVYACTIRCIPALHVKKVYGCDTPIRLTPALHVKKVYGCDAPTRCAPALHVKKVYGCYTLILQSVYYFTTDPDY